MYQLFTIFFYYFDPVTGEVWFSPLGASLYALV